MQLNEIVKENIDFLKKELPKLTSLLPKLLIYFPDRKITSILANLPEKAEMRHLLMEKIGEAYAQQFRKVFDYVSFTSECWKHINNTKKEAIISAISNFTQDEKRVIIIDVSRNKKNKFVIENIEIIEEGELCIIDAFINGYNKKLTGIQLKEVVDEGK